jgi:tripartite-type tricarboxylate transporter receptor subunit TctC
VSACAPAAPASPTAAPAKPAAQPTAAPAAPKPTEAPAAKPAPTTAPAKPAEAKPAASPAAKPAEAKPAASPAAKPALSKAEGATFDEKAVADFYRGKTVRLIAPTTPGASIDLVSRLIAKHIPQYLPGNPNAIVENKPGASGALASNLVFNTEPKDGTVVITPQEGLVLQQALGAPGIEFDANKWQWLGSTLKTVGGCIVRTDAQAKTIQEAIAGKEVIMGVSAPGGTTYDIAATIKPALGANFRLVPGYPAAAELQLAMEKGEHEGYCLSVLGLLQQAAPLVEGPNPLAKFFVVMGNEPYDHPLLKGVPAAETLAKTEEDKTLLRIVNAPQQMNKPWALAPGVPADRVAAMRVAFTRVFADPKFVEEMKTAKQDLAPNTPEEVTRIANQNLSTPNPTIDKLKEILKK